MYEGWFRRRCLWMLSGDDFGMKRLENSRILSVVFRTTCHDLRLTNIEIFVTHILALWHLISNNTTYLIVRSDFRGCWLAKSVSNVYVHLSLEEKHRCYVSVFFIHWLPVIISCVIIPLCKRIQALDFAGKVDGMDVPRFGWHSII